MQSAQLRNKILVTAISCPHLYKVMTTSWLLLKMFLCEVLSGISQQNCEFEANTALKIISLHVIKEVAKEFSAAWRKCFVSAEVQTLIIMGLIDYAQIYRVFIESQRYSHRKSSSSLNELLHSTFLWCCRR